MKRNIITLVFTFCTINLLAQQFKPNLNEVDVEKYALSIVLNDSTDIIRGETVMKVWLSGSVDRIKLNFANKDAIGGMKVTQIKCNGNEVGFEHKNDLLKIVLDKNISSGVYNLSITYQGVPKDGLIIGKNLYGERTFFCDNWPNRAQNWFPCVDHPLDKAKLELKIQLPKKYKVIANGVLKEKEAIDEMTNLFEFETEKPLPTKVMVFGAADFTVGGHDTIKNIPLSSWVYPKSGKSGLNKFKETANAVKFFTEKIGAYPFQKLVSVQSSTIFGGMENAGAIFYPEGRVAGYQSIDETVVHEVAHQWFGNSVTETDFAHLWLSEGFATYLTNLYFEKKYGIEYMKKMLKKQQERVLFYYKRSKKPVVDSLNHNNMSMLNPNSYQKGAWVLHMLRKQTGDELFWQILQEFYNKFKYNNASTNDFVRTAEKVSGKKLNDFFKQWLYHPGHPVINFDWQQKGTELSLYISQHQKNGVVFMFPMELKISYRDKSSEIINIQVNENEVLEKVKLKNSKKVKDVEVDPNNWLLHELY